MTGDFFINNTDVYTTYGITPLKGYLNSLLEPLVPKEPLSIEFEANNGDEVYIPDGTRPVEAREIDIPVALVAADKTDFFTKKAAFETLLLSPELILRFVNISEQYYCYYKSFTAYSQLEALGTNRVSAKFTLKFMEHNPANRPVYVP